MIFNPEKFLQLTEKKYNEFTTLINQKFNDLNGFEPLNVSRKVAILHDILTNNKPFDKDSFTAEDFRQREELVNLEKDRVSKLVSGELKVYIPTTEEYQMLTLTLEEILSTTSTEEEHYNLLKSFNGPA